jgi:hypothetical protein
MQLKRTAQIIWLYYRQVVSYNLIFTFLALGIYFFYGSLQVFPVMFWLKVVGFAFIAYIFHQFNSKEFYFYYNLGLSRQKLLLTGVIIEIISFSMLVFMTSFLIPAA